MSSAGDALSGSARPLLETHDALLVDLDGVVQLDDRPIPGASDALAAARAAGLAIGFITNNAARTPAEVVERLRRLPIRADEQEVVTSSMAAAALLAGSLPAGATVLVVGGPGLHAAVTAAGLRATTSASDDGAAPAAVVQGWGPDVGWRELAEATVALRAGAQWVATNTDRTLPSPRGPLPGSGSLIAAVQTATGRTPDVVAGKPFAPLFDAARSRTGGRSPLVVGDRLDTDIAGARACGLPSLLVLTGVSTPADLLRCEPAARPTYVGRDLSALTRPHPTAEVSADHASAGGTTVTAAGQVDGDVGGGDGLDALRAAAALAWSGALPAEKYDVILHRLGLD